IASAPDPTTGKPDAAKVHNYFATHPDSQPLVEWSSHHTASASYFQSTYYSIHTFWFVDGTGARDACRWRFVPRDGARELTAAQIAAVPHDFLESGFIART